MAIGKLAIAACLALIPFQAIADAAQPDPLNPNDLPTVGCFWTGAFTASNPKTNLAYPGTEIAYWGAKFKTPPGAVLKLEGRFPHARYSSFNAYEGSGTSASSLSDRSIRPDPGSINPSRPGKNRKTGKRSYTVSVLGQAEPQKPARNTLYAEPLSGTFQDILYRVYVPDRGRDLSGGSGLPKPSLKLADGRVLTGEALCSELSSSHNYVPTLMPTGFYSALVNTPGKDPATNPAMPDFGFSKFFNLPNVIARFKSEEQQQAAWAANPEQVGIQYNNNDARYMTGAYSFSYGDVLAIHGRSPSTPRTLNGQKRASTAQLVEWDLCGIQALTTTKTYRCLFDAQIPVRGKKRKYVVAFTKAESRPKNARRACGVAWLEADPEGDGTGRLDAGSLLTRNVLPSAGFSKSIWDVTSPFSAREEMGGYYPRGTYMSKKSFQSHGCPFSWK